MERSPFTTDERAIGFDCSTVMDTGTAVTRSTADQPAPGSDAALTAFCNDQLPKVTNILGARYYLELTLDEIEDVCQEAMAAVCTMTRKRPPEWWADIENPVAYVLTTAEHIIHERRERAGHYTITDPSNLDLNPETRFPEPEAAACKEEILSRLRAELESLPQNYRRALVVYYQLAVELPDDTPRTRLDAAAEVLSMTPGMVRGYVFRGIKMLRQRLRSLSEDTD